MEQLADLATPAPCLTMGLVQLQVPLYVVTPHGPAVAHLIYHNGADHWLFGVFQEETGECWFFPNYEIRLAKNLSEERHALTPIVLSRERLEALRPHILRHSQSPLYAAAAGTVQS
jgi:hypothetical protein